MNKNNRSVTMVIIVLIKMMRRIKVYVENKKQVHVLKTIAKNRMVSSVQNY